MQLEESEIRPSITSRNQIELLIMKCINQLNTFKLNNSESLTSHDENLNSKYSNSSVFHYLKITSAAF